MQMANENQKGENIHSSLENQVTERCVCLFVFLVEEMWISFFFFFY